MPAGMMTGLNGRIGAGGNGSGGGGYDDETGRYDARGFSDDDGLTDSDDEFDESETQVLRPQKARGSRRAAARAAKARAAAAGAGAAGVGAASAAGAAGHGVAGAAGLGAGGAAGYGAAGAAGYGASGYGSASAAGTRAPAGGGATDRVAGSAGRAGGAGGTTGFAAGFGAPGAQPGAVTSAPTSSSARFGAPPATSDRRTATAVAEHGARPGSAVEKLKAKAVRRRRRGWFIVLLVVILAATGAGAGWYFSSGPGGHVTVPTITGQSPDDATATLQGLGLQVGEPESTTSPTVPAGSLIGSDPGDGAAVPNGSAISLIVSAGPAQLTVPPLVGSMQDAATAAVAGLFTVTGSQGQFAGDVAAGTVMQALGADGQPLGATYGEQQPISFVVSLGGIPDVVGKSPADATAALGAVNLQATTGSSDYSESIPEGDVISVGLPPSPIVPGNTITLNTSKGPAPVPVPDVAGKNWADAKAALQSAGFTLKYSQYADLAPAAFVVSGTDPAPGTTVDRGSSVTVSFAGF
ncbi:PASTA domain-containing protein [Subtercola boreus]